MKKFIPLLFMIVFSLLLSGCGRGNVSKVSISNQPSRIYTDLEISKAVDAAVEYFGKEFGGCTLIEIGYIGDESGREFIERASQYGVDRVIILTSTFEVGPEGGDGSLNPNDTYRNWKWILGKTNGGQWKHLDHGYG